MGFKMKKPSIIEGTAKHKEEVKDKKQRRLEGRLEKISKKANKSQRKDFEKSGGESYVKHMAKGDHSKKTKRLHKRFDKVEEKLDNYIDKRDSATTKKTGTKQKLKKVSSQLKKSVKAHAKQADIIDNALDSPMKGKKDACYHKVKSRVKVWPSAYASGQLVQCRKAGAGNWGTKSKK